MVELALFVSTFLLVFALGFQSLNVNGGHYVAAFATSFVIGLSQLVLYKLVPDAGAIEVLAYLSGGPLGIVCSMWCHRRTVGRRRRIPPRAPHNSIHWLTEDERRRINRDAAHGLNTNCGADRP